MTAQGNNNQETEDQDLFCLNCEKFHGPTCKFKDDRAPPNEESKACPEYEQKKEEQPCVQGQKQIPIVDSPFFNDKGVFIPKLLADRVMSIFSFLTMQDSREVFVYVDGVYQPIGEITIKQTCRKLLEEEYRKSRALEVIDYIETSTYIERKEEPPNLIPVKNGVLNLQTMMLEEFSPTRIFFNKIPVDYKPNATCPKIQTFLEEVTRDKDDITTLLEMAGFCLYREYFVARALMLVGGGSNGKSVFLRLVTKFLGRKNVSARSLQDLETQRFAKADLANKLANIHADLPDKALQTTGMFKMLTGQDTITGEKKFLHAFEFLSVAKQLYSCNKVPEVKDDTDAYFRRWAIVVFDKVFVGENCDPFILDKLSTDQELSGLLNLALDGLKRLLQNGNFSNSKSTQTVKEDYIRKSSPVAAFCMDELEADSDAFIEKKNLYQAFLTYCRENKLPTITPDTFFKNIVQNIAVRNYRPEIKLDDKKTLRPTSFIGCRYQPVPSTASIASRGFFSLSISSNSYPEFSFINSPWKRRVIGKSGVIIKIAIPPDELDGLDGTESSKAKLTDFQKPDENREPIRLERVQLEKEEFVQKLRETFSPDKGYTRDKVKAVLLQEGFSESDVELKILDLERARIITIDDANIIFLTRREV